MSGLNIIYLYADSNQEWNCSEWRCHIPANVINAAHEAGQSPHKARLFYMPSAVDWNNPEVQKQLGLADVLVFQRNIIVPEVWQAMDYWRALGRLVVIDLDDHYPHLPPSNPAFQYWIRNASDMDKDPIEALTEGMRHADALTSPSKVILQDWAHIIPGYWLPNWTGGGWYKDLVQKPVGALDKAFNYEPENEQPVLQGNDRLDSAGQIILGWGGSISHVDSWLYSGIHDALDRIFEKWPNARLKFCGHEERLNTYFERYGDRVIRQLGVIPAHWPFVIASFDIGLAPLDTRPLDPPWREGAPIASYDERRSWLKAVEYLCTGVPWIASRSATYNDLKHMGTVVDNTSDAWFNALDRKISHLAEEKQVAWNRRKWAMKKLTMEGNLSAYADIFGRMMAERATKYGARLPGITYVEKEKEAA